MRHEWRDAHNRVWIAQKDEVLFPDELVGTTAWDGALEETAAATSNEILRLSSALTAIEERVKELEAWKRDQKLVESQWDAQAVGKLLGVPLGDQIRPMIQPGIEKLAAHNRKLRDAIISLAFKAEYMAKEMGRYSDLIPVKAQMEREIAAARTALEVE